MFEVLSKVLVKRARLPRVEGREASLPKFEVKPKPVSEESSRDYLYEARSNPRGEFYIYIYISWSQIAPVRLLLVNRKEKKKKITNLWKYAYNTVLPSPPNINNNGNKNIHRERYDRCGSRWTEGKRNRKNPAPSISLPLSLQSLPPFIPLFSNLRTFWVNRPPLRSRNFFFKKKKNIRSIPP